MAGGTERSRLRDVGHRKEPASSRAPEAAGFGPRAPEGAGFEPGGTGRSRLRGQRKEPASEGGTGRSQEVAARKHVAKVSI